MFDAGDLIVVNFPGVTGVKRRPAIVLSSATYHSARPDIIVGLITSQAVAIGPTDYALRDWTEAGLRAPSVFPPLQAEGTLSGLASHTTSVYTTTSDRLSAFCR